MKGFLPLLCPSPSNLLHSIPRWALKAKGNGICLDFLPNLFLLPLTEESWGPQRKKLWPLLNRRLACLFSWERDAFCKGIRTWMLHLSGVQAQGEDRLQPLAVVTWYLLAGVGTLVSVKSSSPLLYPQCGSGHCSLSRWLSPNHPCPEWLSVFPKVRWRLVSL